MTEKTVKVQSLYNKPCYNMDLSITHSHVVVFVLFSSIEFYKGIIGISFLKLSLFFARFHIKLSYPMVPYIAL